VSKQADVTFFIDRSISQKTVPEALNKTGASVEKHDDHFLPETSDVEWLQEISNRGWVILTKDAKIGSRTLEVAAIARTNARVFILVSGNLTSKQMASILVDALEKLKKFSQGNQAPFIAKLYKEGRVRIWRNRTQLLKLIREVEL